MDQQVRRRRIAAVKAADAINAIEGAPVSEYAHRLSSRWARGEITGEEMKSTLLKHYRESVVEAQSRG